MRLDLCVTLSLTCEARHILTNHVYEIVFDLLVESDDRVEHGGTGVDNTGEFGIAVSSVCGRCVVGVCVGGEGGGWVGMGMGCVRVAERNVRRGLAAGHCHWYSLSSHS